MSTSLWEFALDFYNRPGVSTACLALQDEVGIDVVHLIVIVYADWIGEPLTGDEIVPLQKFMAEWRERSVLPLRAVRRFLKTPMEGLDDEKERLRDAVKAAELKAEAIQLAMAEAWLKRRELGGGVPLSQGLMGLLAASSANVSAHRQVQKSIETILAARSALESPEADRNK